MKKILTIICILSMFPVLSSARRSKPNITPKDTSTLTQPTNRAFDNKLPLRPMGECKGECATRAQDVLSPEAIRAVNNMEVQGKYANDLGQVFSYLPAVALQGAQHGFTGKTLTTALTAAAVQSKGWEPAAQAKVLETAKDIAEHGITESNKNKVKEIERNCML